MEISLFVKKHVLAVLYYGSSIDGTSHTYSDIDICIVAPKLTKNKRKEICSAFSSQKCDLKFFDELPIIVKKEIMHAHRVLYAADEKELFEYFLFWQKVYDHFAPYYHETRRTLSERLSEWKSKRKLKSGAI